MFQFADQWAHHGVSIAQSALGGCAFLAEPHIFNRHFGHFSEVGVLWSNVFTLKVLRPLKLERVIAIRSHPLSQSARVQAPNQRATFLLLNVQSQAVYRNRRLVPVLLIGYHTFTFQKSWLPTGGSIKGPNLRHST